MRTSFLGGGKTSRSTASSIASREKWASTISSPGSKSAWPYWSRMSLHDVLAQALAGQSPGQGVAGELAVGRVGRLAAAAT